MKSKNPLFSENGPPSIEPLALRPRECALALGISERLLYEWTNAEGLPHLRIRNTLLYPIETTRTWLQERTRASRGDINSTGIDNVCDASLPLHD